MTYEGTHNVKAGENVFWANVYMRGIGSNKDVKSSD